MNMLLGKKEGSMNPILIASIVSLALATGALAQTSNAPASARPNESSVPMDKPDSSLPSPCGLGQGTTVPAKFEANVPTPPSPNLPDAGKHDGAQIAETQCAANGPPVPLTGK
jgi:hypothetical protein